jgi:ribosomal-protein-alanine N-acetyltransferase
MSAISPVPILTPAHTATRSIVIEPMDVHDIPAVMEIERMAFPRPWPEKAYRYELAENDNAYFVVARALNIENATASSTSPWHRLAQLLHLPHLPGRTAAQTARIAPHAAPVLGFAGMWMYVDEAHIATIATHPSVRGRGIGERILLDLLHEAQRRHAVTVTLEVRVSNIVAQNLYRKYEFEEVGRRKAYYHDNREDALLMTITNFESPAYRERLEALEHSLVSGS